MAAGMATELDQLKAVFDRERQNLINQGAMGRWAVVAGNTVEGVHESYAQAVLAAHRSLRGKPYLVQEVLPQERVESVQLVSWD